MDAELEPACVVQQAQCPGMKRPPSEDFPPQIGLSDKIPPVKPCFKKKQQVQKRLGAETLRALRPIFTSLLGAGNLDGVFVPRGQSGGHRNVCEPVVKKALELSAPCPQPDSNVAVLMPGTPDVQGQMPETHPPPGHAEQEIQSGVQGFPSETNPGTAADSTNESFQHHPCHSVQSDAAVCPDKILESYTSGLFQENSCMTQYNLNPNDDFNAGLFQDKSEEASLDLVFELLNQLQYHTHQEDGIEICVEFLQGNCIYGSDCPKHHTVLPYHWQIRRTATQTWQSVTNDSQEHLERLYCNPDNDRIKVKYRGHEFLVDLNVMNLYETIEFDQLRRLSTPSCPSSNSNYYTVWKYFCRDHFGWREYSEPVVQLIEEANCRGLKEVRFVTWHNQYILNIKDGFQQNACFRREIKRRPLLRSCVVLMPFLQTLGGNPPISTPSAESASSQVLSPTTITSPNLYPETWISMDPAQDFIQVPVSKEDKSYRTIYNLFHKTVPETKYRVLKIQRVQNQFLWEKYKRKKEYMSKKMTGLDRIMNERHLFHGTSQDVVDGICKHNFDPRVCGKHATMFGQGSYFARKASYSHNFSKRSPKGVHYMFLAKVLTGRYTVGNHTMRRPPPVNPGSITSDLYDSCVDNYFEPQIFVIFNDDQSYPYFVIQYEEVSNTVSI
ncbi:protein mono-ADP-ribosyltransferase TIPARP [Pelodiscus sinensis]|uniref:TCDD inducible poly(ADP-ribose) polymerase n=1 Tax=Pelodiscus sinensis TaxID=13735 RepID=K7FBX9_PELSI|nr:TCDD-inducible poly [ADP-ribose] polymerase [Pelodiscus sinensis]XP_006123534.1 TCDD-inducible poly [ADP-ribose] polymerase [Pelodiscus sinensis]XP_006123535.1 TCDD-inducible poly [ADP-ribose] polymerase [Pelodiscus sinensis]|eukprot:XP_006123533.1 TCDD-inducible poly [ADP-ribose] polymerase [Pelodiscus sinensis]